MEKTTRQKSHSKAISVVLSQGLYVIFSKVSSCIEEYFKMVVLKFSEISSKNTIGEMVKVNFQY